MASPSSAGVALTIFRFCLSTLPFLAVLAYLLYQASQRGNVNDNDNDNDNDNGNDDANDDGNENDDNANANVYENDDLFSLMDSTLVFLSFHVFWTLFAVYLLVFIPKRRYLLDRYLREGESTIGDVVVDEPSSSTKKFGFHCLSFRKYGYAIYSHPTKIDPPMVIRKKVRVYQPYTRERITILRLPNRPLSGQAKTDIEIDLSQMRTERSTTLCYISAVSLFWVLFSLAGAAFCTYQMGAIGDGNLVGNENAKRARRTLLIVVGINPFFALVVNSIRFLMYHNWMVHRGASIKDEGEARKNLPENSKWLGFYNKEEAFDDSSDQIPYSILGENRSFAGTIPNHNRSVITNTTAGETTEMNKSHLKVSSVEKEGSSLRILPWTSP